MTAEEAAMIMMSGGKSAVIEPLMVTVNGEYKVPKGTDGYNPVNVSVPDRYNDGYKDGYAQGYKDGYEEGYKDGYEQGNKDGYEEGYKDGQENGEYTFPEGTNYEDIYNSIGGDTVIDKTVGYGVASRTEIDPNDPTRENVSVIVVNSVGEKVTGLYGIGAPAKDDWRVDNIHVYNTGHVDMIFSYLSSYDGTRQTSEHSAFSVYLVGFGANGNEIAVRK